MVGDADQSIYAFRGATIRNILEFERDYPDARTILLEQNYRSTQTILTAANAVIDRNTGRKPKSLWSDQGAGEQIVGYVADTEHAEADWVAREIDRLDDDGLAPARRRGRVLPDQRPVPRVRGDLHPGRPAVQGGRRGALLRAQGGPRRAGLPAGGRQRRRHGERPPGPQHPAPRHRRPGRGLRGGAVDARPHLVRRRRCAGPRRRPACRPGGQRDRRLRRAARRAARDERGRPAGGGAGGGAAALRLPRRAGGEHRPAGRGPGGKPAGAGQRRPRVHRAGRGRWPPPRTRTARSRRAAVPGRLPRAGLAGGRRRPGARRRPRPPGRGHADDPAHREGPGVPGGVPDRPGGRRLPAHAGRWATSTSWRRSGGWPTSASPGPGSGSTCPGR